MSDTNTLHGARHLALAEILGQRALERGVTVAPAESCTGGWVAQAITAISGSSEWFETGYVTYSNRAKQRLLGVKAATLEDVGAVSEEVVRQMVSGACRDSEAQLAVAVSGVAGPGGGSPDKPVGTVWFGWGNAEEQQAEVHLFKGDRASVRSQAVDVALQGLIDRI